MEATKILVLPGETPTDMLLFHIPVGMNISLADRTAKKVIKSLKGATTDDGEPIEWTDRDIVAALEKCGFRESTWVLGQCWTAGS